MSLFAALDGEGNTRYIGDVVRGAACGCICAACKSPLVAKHGTDHIWHFAHEALQERPACLPGSINLLRRLAIEQLLQSESLALPDCREVLSSNLLLGNFTEVAQWTLPLAYVVQRDLQAPFNQPVAHLRMEAFAHQGPVGLWVQIGDMLAQSDESFQGELIYHCPAPAKGAITTEASAVAYLQKNGLWHWHRMPDVFGELGRARARLQSQLDAHQVARLAKAQYLRDVLAQRAASSVRHPQRPPQRSWPLSEPREIEAPVAPLPSTLPPWAHLKKVNTSFFAFQMNAQGESWIVMSAADREGYYYIVPGGGLQDGWDESLPPSAGQADLVKGAYCGEGAIDRAIQVVRSLGVAASRIDSDAVTIATFTGWTD